MLIKDLPEEDRPRERLKKISVDNLSDIELLAIILKTGTKNISSKEIAINIIDKFKSIQNLKGLNVYSFKDIKGVGEVKAIEIISAIELGKRVYSNIENNNLNSPQKVYTYFNHLLKNKKQEYFYAIYLDAKGNMITKKLLFLGTVNASMVHPREVFKEAYLCSAVSIIVVHNHPSGDIKPSKEDNLITNKLVEIGNIQGIKLIDHVIIGKDSYYSFNENNRI